MTTIINTAGLETIRKRLAHASLRGEIPAQQLFDDARDLLALIDDIIEQAHEGVFVAHDCPAMFACAYVIAQCCEPQT
jgi:hypothetical protein